jgi:DNA-binding CsgD family transcriptional regulator
LCTDRRTSWRGEFGKFGTPAELRLLHFLPTHLSLQEIRDHLCLSRATVKTHIASIYRKLAVNGRSEAVDLIDQLGLDSTKVAVTPAERLRP